MHGCDLAETRARDAGRARRAHKCRADDRSRATDHRTQDGIGGRIDVEVTIASRGTGTHGIDRTVEHRIAVRTGRACGSRCADAALRADRACVTLSAGGTGRACWTGCTCVALSAGGTGRQAATTCGLEPQPLSPLTVETIRAFLLELRARIVLAYAGLRLIEDRSSRWEELRGRTLHVVASKTIRAR